MLGGDRLRKLVVPVFFSLDGEFYYPARTADNITFTEEAVNLTLKKKFK
jgi:hypothetical protein